MNIPIRKLIRLVQASLTRDLLNQEYLASNVANPLLGYSYVASEALFYLIPELVGAGLLPENHLDYQPFMSLDEAGLTHWWLQKSPKDRLDPTVEQHASQGKQPPYEQGVPKSFQTLEMSRPTKIVVDRVRASLKAMEHILQMTNSRFGQGFCEWLMLALLSEWGFKPQRVNEELSDFLLPGPNGPRRCDSKGSRKHLIKRNDYRPSSVGPYKGRDRRKGREYFQVIFFWDTVALFVEHRPEELPEPKFLAWFEIAQRLSGWGKTRREHHSAGNPETRARQDAVKAKICSMFPEGFRPRPITRGSHNSSAPGASPRSQTETRQDTGRPAANEWKDHVHNSFPSPQQLKTQCCTVFFQLNEAEGCVDDLGVEYLIAYPHKEIKTLLGDFISPAPRFMVHKGLPYYIDYRQIRERKVSPFFCENFDDLKRFIEQFFPRK